VADNNNRRKILTNEVLTNIVALNRFACSLCQNKNEAEEVVAETVVKAFEKLNQLKDETKIKQWLFRILNNVFINKYRKEKGKTTINVDPHDHSFSLFEKVALSSYTDNQTPEKTFITKLTNTKIEQAINELPEEFRVAIVLCDVNQFSYGEIASITQVPVGTVRSRIARARSLLQKRLWLYAVEMGIKTKSNNKNYICTCGNEEIKPSEAVLS
jgi:RNA polymerase sigma-70 factor, ECF subfamily